MKKNRLYVGVMTMVLLLGACQGDEKSNDEKSERVNETAGVAVQGSQEPIVKIVVEEKPFYRELAGNGKVKAVRSSELRFNTAGWVEHVWVKNGDRVRAGQKLAQLELFRLEKSLAQAKDNLAQSELELQDVLIGRGYSLDRQDEVPDEEMELAKVKSGYNKALIAWQLAEEELRKATLYAPFDGVIANLNTKELNMAPAGEPFCLVLNDRQVEVNFAVLESELALLAVGTEVTVVPFAQEAVGKTLHGRVVEINPYVESNGMVQVKAVVTNNGTLLEGMNVNVLLRNRMAKSLVIPKSAVVMRSGKTVVFTQVKGKAQWNYVQVVAENSDSCVVAPRSKEYEGLSAGDTVIVAGNLNLAHDSELK